MYGLVNKSVQDLITARFGADKWQEIRKSAGVTVDSFVSMEAYPDKMTYDLVAAASRVLGASPEELLEAFGEHWVEDTGRQGYGALMNLKDTDFVSFLCDLDNMHSRVAMTFPKLRPPSFACSDIGPGTLRLHYHSTRSGLSSMILGLIRGLARSFNLEEMHIVHDVRRDDGAEHDEYLITWREP